MTPPLVWIGRTLKTVKYFAAVFLKFDVLLKTYPYNFPMNCLIPSLANEIVEAIKKADKVEALRLEGNTIGAEASESIASALKLRPEFKASIYI